MNLKYQNGCSTTQKLYYELSTWIERVCEYASLTAYQKVGEASECAWAKPWTQDWETLHQAECFDKKRVRKRRTGKVDWYLYGKLWLEYQSIKKSDRSKEITLSNSYARS